MIWDIYNALLADDVISDLVDDRIKFYEYPEAKDVKESHIIIDPIGVPTPDDYADDKWLTDDFMYQIDVWSNDMEVVSVIASKVRMIMWELNFKQKDGMNEYDNDYGIYRDARRYRGKAYRKDYDSL